MKTKTIHLCAALWLVLGLLVPQWDAEARTHRRHRKRGVRVTRIHRWSERVAGKQTKVGPFQGPVQAPAYVLMDVDSGRVLVEHNAHKRMFPASTTKTMTALVAMTQGNLDQVVRVGPNAAQTGETGIYLLEGEQFTIRDLVRAALIKSANDACVAIAEGVAGSVPAFAKMMNAKAQELGARNTHFVNPHGLHDPNHYTTAYDLALIAREAMRYPFFNETIKIRTLPIHGNYKLGAERLLLNRNRLLFRWAECDGVKTGYTKQAGRCLIASATRLDPVTRKPWRLLGVVLHSPNSWDDSAYLLKHWGFERYRPVEVAHAGEVVTTMNVAGGAFDAKGVTAENGVMPLRQDEQNMLGQRVREFKLKAPVQQGRTVGYVEYTVAGRKVGEVRLVAQEAVPR
ncbi:MAG: D-alanyl-D-alanine carboxypeptidase, partial [Armatimonadota bacterium]|nr:D-alanyl-D-alanine carboxypeptidase [Armatimonadota bacterium]